jgi:hypothetical protein
MAYDASFNIVTSLISKTPKDAYAKIPQRVELIGSLPRNAHANLDIIPRRLPHFLGCSKQPDPLGTGRAH